ncbi:hypothetical protein ACFOLC_12060 [Lysobacter cavernae]|uniref:Uncharacterized protein n=1 Tax=Lysobacter cavernae TaxID=1685901 RepID=A0ABV7RU67_9GAMM
MTLHNLTLDNVSDDALMARMYELARGGDHGTVESMQLDAAIYARLAETYGEASQQEDRQAA